MAISHWQAFQVVLWLMLLVAPPLTVSSRRSFNIINGNFKEKSTKDFSSSSSSSNSSSPFPPNFFFGTSTSSYQYEGAYLSDGRSLSNWDVYSHTPGSIVGGGTGDVADDQYHLYEEDVEVLASMGVNGHKISISWSRVLPNGRHGNINWEGINYYKKLINALLLKGIEPFVTISHYDHPQELEDRHRGWLGSEMREEYVHLAEVCFKYLGDGVKYWVTFNEPNAWAILGYTKGLWPPNRCLPTPGDCAHPFAELDEPFIAAHNLILAHASAVDIYRKYYKEEQGGEIGIAIVFYWYEPLSNSTADILATKRGQSFFENWFLDPIIHGTYPQDMKDILGPLLPEFSRSDLEILKNGRLDFLGVNHYTTMYIQDCLSSSCDSSMAGSSKVGGYAGQSMSKNGVLIGELTGLPYLSVYPLGMEKVITHLKETFPHIPLYVTENGYCDKTTPNSSIEEVLNDTKRVEFFSGYLDSVATAIRKGADVRGYFVWSFLDNFEWTYGYTKRMGLYSVDRATLKRTPKLSARWYKKFIAENLQMDGSRLMKKMDQ